MSRDDAIIGLPGEWLSPRSGARLYGILKDWLAEALVLAVDDGRSSVSEKELRQTGYSAGKLQAIRGRVRCQQPIVRGDQPLHPDGSGYELFAKGLRDAVGLAFQANTNPLWATVNGRDTLGDDVP